MPARSGCKFPADPEESCVRRSVRRLTRRADRTVVAGVASGLGAYFSLDPQVTRLVPALLVPPHGLGLALSLVAWAVMPSAGGASRPPNQRYDARGASGAVAGEPTRPWSARAGTSVRPHAWTTRTQLRTRVEVTLSFGRCSPLWPGFVTYA
ncbi:MAG: PspC domain-containing protein [Egibacteraceae bacterium]